MFGTCLTLGNQGCVRFEFKTTPSSDQYTTIPSNQNDLNWFNSKISKIVGYSTYWDSRIPSYNAESWFYQDSSAIYLNSADARNHPNWILKNQYGVWMYINYNCYGNGTCAQYAVDYSNEDFRKWWIAKARATFDKGYKGIFIDDVNFQMNLSNGWNADTPIDPNTGENMTQQNWEKYFAGFLKEVRQAFADKTITHNALWFAGMPKSDSYISEEVSSANFINLERGFDDSGLTTGTGFWTVNNFMTYIDQVNSYPNTKVLLEQYGYDNNDFALACYLLVNNGGDLFANDGINPNSWNNHYDVNLGSAKNSRYTWNNLTRRDFAKGIVLVNLTGTTIKTDLPDEYKTFDGTIIDSITLDPKESAVLTYYGSTILPNGTYFVYSGVGNNLVLDDPNWATHSGIQPDLWSYNGGKNQSWKFISIGNNVYTIQCVSNGLYLTSPTGFNKVTLETKISSDLQAWTLKKDGKSYVIVNKQTGLALADPASSKTQGTGVIVWYVDNGIEQNWEIH